ncbi:MAG: mannonate dehydratase [Lachnospiraceae bacterium]|nr:mannonate dehydratase [Lachnospiraceae bacterium]
MKTILRWFPDGDDSVTLKEIRQIPGVSGVAACLPRIPVGEVWPLDRLKSLRDEINAYGLECEVIESVNIHEDIKKGLPSRDRYIDAYIATIRNLAAIGVRCLCYNFMPVMDWIRSDLAAPAADGSTVMEYIHDTVIHMSPDQLADAMSGKARGYSLPGWEPERIRLMQADIEFYRGMTQDDYWANLKYFLDAVVPAAEQCSVALAIHPDDPPWQLFGLPKVITNAENIRRFLSLNNSRYNGLTLCSGSLSADMDNDIPAMIREFGGMGRIHFAHVRNIRHTSPIDFQECAHMSACGDLDMFEIMRAYHDVGFDGYLRPDHGRMIWGEKARPGYGLYDRALGVQYLLGIREALEKM